MKKIIFVLAIMLSSTVFAQNVEFTKDNFNDNTGLKEAKSRIEAGNKLFEQGPMFYKSALFHYLTANKFNPNNAMLNFKIGACYLYSSTKLRSIPYLEKALKLNPAVDP